MSTKPGRRVKKEQTRVNDNSNDPLDSLMSMVHFDEPVRKKNVERPLKTKDLEIDLEKDSQEDIIKKLVENNKALREELKEFKMYVEGTFCTFAIHHRVSNDIEKKLEELTNAVENLE